MSSGDQESEINAANVELSEEQHNYQNENQSLHQSDILTGGQETNQNDSGVNYRGQHYQSLAENYKGYENLVINIRPRNVPITIVGQSQRILTCESILFQCARPQFNRYQKCLGVMNMMIPGSGLTMCCLYGCGRPDCSDVCFAGCMQLICVPFGGWISACMVGVKMLMKD